MLDEEQVAKMLEVAVRTIRGWRTAGTGPKFSKVGRRVWYRKTRIYEWLESRECDSTDDAKPKPRIMGSRGSR